MLSPNIPLGTTSHNPEIPNAAPAPPSRRIPNDRTRSLEGLPWPTAPGKHLRIANLTPAHQDELAARQQIRRSGLSEFQDFIARQRKVEVA